MNRLKVINSIRENLANGGCSIGSWIQVPHASIAEIMGKAGYDWIAVDMEHGSISTHQLPDLFRALELGRTLPLVRVAEGKVKDCKQALDSGAGGIIVPMVENAEQLQKIRDITRWPPSGNRGVAFTRANLFGKYFDEYVLEAQKPLLIAMIENVNAVDELDNILRVEDLDAIMIGPYDLSASMGITANFEDKNFIAVIDIIKQKSVLAKIPCGMHIVRPSSKDLQIRIGEGYRFIAYSMDSVFLNHSATRPSINFSMKT